MVRISTMKRCVACATLVALVVLLALPVEGFAKGRAKYRPVQWQRVEALVKKAHRVYKQPARYFTPGFTTRPAHKMEVIADLLRQAYELDPFRTDLLFDIANSYAYMTDMVRATEVYREILAVAPDNVNARIYLAVYSKMLGNDRDSRKYLKELAHLNPAKAKDTRKMLSIIDGSLKAPVPSTLPLKLPKRRHAIVVLGQKLNDDGTMHPILIRRLKGALSYARHDPEALIIVTGGVPHAGKTEATQMARWLVNHGVDPSRIRQNDYARSTVENALYSGYILSREGIEHATLISSAAHLRRALTIFQIAMWETGPRDIEFDVFAVRDPSRKTSEEITPKIRAFIYRDALRTYGLWNYISPPFVER